MDPPKVTAVLVLLVMLGGFGYITWTSRQVARAFDRIDESPPAHVEQINEAVREAQRDMGG